MSDPTSGVRDLISVKMFPVTAKALITFVPLRHDKWVKEELNKIACWVVFIPLNGWGRVILDLVTLLPQVVPHC